LDEALLNDSIDVAVQYLKHEKSAQDALESEESFSQSKEMQRQSEGLRTQAKKDRAATAFDEKNQLYY
jgi:hypothetical protein